MITLPAIFYNPMLYFGLALLAFLAWGSIKTVFRSVPLLNNRMTFIAIAVIIGLAAGGWLGTIGLGSIGGSSVDASGVTILDGSTGLQVTTSFNHSTNGTGSIAESTNQDDVLEVRFFDANVSETAVEVEVYRGILTVTRTGSLAPASCTVQATLPDKYEDQSAPNGNVFNIVEIDALGVGAVYIQDGGEARTTSPRMQTSLTFADGDSTQTVGFAIQVDEEGHDALNQYNHKDVVFDICGKPYKVEVYKLDA